jgi:hypothetical protein
MDTFFYPDVIVSCHKKDHQAEQYLSDSTEAYDRVVPGLLLTGS